MLSDEESLLNGRFLKFESLIKTQIEYRERMIKRYVAPAKTAPDLLANSQPSTSNQISTDLTKNLISLTSVMSSQSSFDHKLDPSVYFALNSLASSLHSSRAQIHHLQARLHQSKFTKNSENGKRILTRIRLLEQENQQLLDKLVSLLHDSEQEVERLTVELQKLSEAVRSMGRCNGKRRASSPAQVADLEPKKIRNRVALGGQKQPFAQASVAPRHLFSIIATFPIALLQGQAGCVSWPDHLFAPGYFPIHPSLFGYTGVHQMTIIRRQGVSPALAEHLYHAGVAAAFAFMLRLLAGQFWCTLLPVYHSFIAARVELTNDLEHETYKLVNTQSFTS
ncbi:hypothetical protein Ciccas_006958 [Cichlidogyrus casuarinus]|uniref:Uncharacterized protein n=1 Tax=Cichlidogyrus casuarinus TaxID=1844966 RepID=A0ABD2Q5D1_9PLAT